MSDDVHSWFGLSYASWLVWPRAYMQAMPEDWQRRFTELAAELDAAAANLPRTATFQVTAVSDSGRFEKLPKIESQYRHSRVRMGDDGKLMAGPVRVLADVI